MADIEKVRVGDELKVTCKVIYLHEDKSNGVAGVKVSCRGIHGWLTDEDVEAAEHIPAPKVFKRGDKVYSPSKWGYGPCGRQDGLVLGADPLNEDRTMVHWGEGARTTPWMNRAQSVLTHQLEHDEAPE